MQSEHTYNRGLSARGLYAVGQDCRNVGHEAVCKKIGNSQSFRAAVERYIQGIWKCQYYCSILYHYALTLDIDQSILHVGFPLLEILALAVHLPVHVNVRARRPSCNVAKQNSERQSESDVERQ